jgi:hypothetical protein
VNGKTLAFLAALTAAAGGGAFYVAQQRNAPADTSQYTGQLVQPALSGRIDALARIEIERDGNPVVLTRQTDGTWILPAKGGYPVDFDQVRRLALDIAELRILEARTSNPALFAEIDLDGHEKGQKATRVALFGTQGEHFGTLLVGRTRFGRQGTAGDGTFVRNEGSNQVWLAQGRVTVEREAAKWLVRRVSDVARERVSVAHTVGADGAAIDVSRDTPAQEDFALSPLPEGKKIKSAFDVNLVASALEALDLEDVRKAEGLVFPGTADYAEFKTFDGLAVRAEFARDGTDVWVRFVAKHTAPAEPIPEGGKLKPAADVAKEAETIAKRTAGWAYKLPGYKMEYMTRKLADLVDDKAP